jgi:precorrin-6B methylase 2
MRPAQIRRMVFVMHWHAGESIAEIGAGDGALSTFAADRIGPSGHVYANEIDPAMLANIKAAAARQGLRNITTVLVP